MTYKEFALEIAKEAGEIIRTNFCLGMKKEWKGDGSPVTETDKKINRLVIEAAKKNFPDHGVMGEEESDYHESHEYVWVCDPLDGTIPFSHGIPLPLFMLALVKDGEPILGVIYDPLMDRMFCAEKGRGTYLNEKRVNVSDLNQLKGGLVDVCTWTRAPYHIPGLMDAVEDAGATVIRLDAVYGIVLIACGEMLGSIFTGNTAHDAAAVKIIVEEAGGKATDLDGNNQRYDRPIKGLVLSNGKVHDKLLEIVQQHSLSSSRKG